MYKKFELVFISFKSLYSKCTETSLYSFKSVLSVFILDFQHSFLFLFLQFNSILVTQWTCKDEIVVSDDFDNYTHRLRS